MSLKLENIKVNIGEKEILHNINLDIKEGEFISKEDLRVRSKVSKTVIETLSNHGCLEGMSETNQLSLF